MLGAHAMVLIEASFNGWEWLADPWVLYPLPDRPEKWGDRQMARAFHTYHWFTAALRGDGLHRRYAYVLHLLLQPLHNDAKFEACLKIDIDHVLSTWF